eukprot:12013507-Prorocentrum_lima.AAC.1
MVLGWILGRLCPLVLWVWLSSCCVRVVVVVVGVLQWPSCGIMFGFGVGCAVATLFAHIIIRSRSITVLVLLRVA